MLYISAYNLNLPEAINDEGEIVAFSYLNDLIEEDPNDLQSNFLLSSLLYTSDKEYSKNETNENHENNN